MTRQCSSCLSSYADIGAPCPSCGAREWVDDSLMPGSIVGGRYRIDRILGRGGFGITYAATYGELGLWAAVKELFPVGSTRMGSLVRPPTTTGPTAFDLIRDRLVAEGRTLSRFDHPGIVRVFDVVRENDTAYLVMELLEGSGLDALITAHGHLDEVNVVELINRTAEALGVLHAQGVLHRDIKPGNIIWHPRRGPVLIDFGSARELIGAHTTNATTLVTHSYSPPEQYQSRGNFGPPTDIYALCATAHHALTGTPPPTAMERAFGPDPYIAPPSTYLELAPLIARGMSLRIDDRPQGTAELRIDPLASRSVRRGEPGHKEMATRAPVTGQSNPIAPIPQGGPIVHTSILARPNGKFRTILGSRRFQRLVGLVGAALLIGPYFVGILSSESNSDGHAGDAEAAAAETASPNSVAPLEAIPTPGTNPTSTGVPSTISEALSTKPEVEIPVGDPPKTLQVTDLVLGTGAEAVRGSNLKVQYVGVSYSTKKHFDASWDRDATPYDLVDLGNAPVIAGWNEGLLGAKQGSRRQLIVPPDKGYGDTAKPGIKAGETLVFVVDIIDVQPPAGAATTAFASSSTINSKR